MDVQFGSRPSTFGQTVHFRATVHFKDRPFWTRLEKTNILPSTGFRFESIYNSVDLNSSPDGKVKISSDQLIFGLSFLVTIALNQAMTLLKIFRLVSECPTVECSQFPIR